MFNELTSGGLIDSQLSINVPIFYRAIPDPELVVLAPSANIAAGGEATTSRLTGGTGTFLTGRRWDNENGADSIDIAADGNTEVEWSIVARAGKVSDGTVLLFRVVADGAPLNAYTQTPQWTIGTPVVPLPPGLNSREALTDPDVGYALRDVPQPSVESLPAWRAASGVTGTVASTLAGASSAASGIVDNRGTLSSALAGVTCAAAGQVGANATGTIASTLGGVAGAASGVVQAAGTIASTLAGATSAADGVVNNRGTIAATLGGVTMAGAGTVDNRGTIAATLADVTCALSGVVGNVVAGSVAATLADVTMAGSGTVQNSASGSISSALAGVTMAAAGSADVLGTVAATLAGAAMSASGEIRVAGPLTSTLAGVSIAAAGTVTAVNITGTIGSTLGDVSFAGFGYVGIPPTGGDSTVRRPSLVSRVIRRP